MKNTRIANAFSKAKSEGRGAFVAYLTIGYPTLAESEAAADALVANGADVLELGVPFSDPFADGGVIRYRCWDSCMYSQFTRMAHGNNRNTQKERFRQRFMHKLVYFPENNDGVFSCVGCGRCLAKCPISMNIVKVMKTVGGESK